jgi:hypothetical protein
MRAITRRSALIAAGGFSAGLIGSTAVGESWLRNDGRRSLTILGSGRGLSVLLTSAGARMLLLGGSDYTDFGNALSSARFPLLDRIDMVLITGEKPNIRLVEHALRQTEPRNVYSIGGAADLLDAGVAVDRALTVPHRFTLPGDSEVTLDVDERESGSPWSMLVRWRTHQLLIDSGGSVDHLPPVARRVSAWVRVSGSFSAEDILHVQPAATFVDADAMEGWQVRDVVRQSGHLVYGYRVHGGDIAQLQLDASGLNLPGNPANDPSDAEE